MIRRCHNRELYRSDKLRSHGTASSDTFTRRAKLASLPATGSLLDQDPSKIINLYFKGLAQMWCGQVSSGLKISSAGERSLVQSPPGYGVAELFRKFRNNQEIKECLWSDFRTTNCSA